MRNWNLGKWLSAMVLGGSLAAFVGGLAACGNQVTADLSSPAGQLFCTLSKGAAGQVVVGIINAEASKAGPVAVLATNATAATVQADCDAAAKATGATAGLPVSPPATPVASVAIPQ